MQEFIETWGYFAVFLGSLVEGESVIFVAGFLAHEGYLSLAKIIVIAFLGTLFADQVLYHIGRHYGPRVINKFPSIQPKADHAFKLLKKYDTLYLLSFRFIYGIRIISPLIIGSSGVEFIRFTILNFIAALIWSVGSCVAAYYFAHLIMDELHLLPKVLLGVALVGGGIGYCLYKFRKRRA
ncbi:MAG: DedA family protein [Proteobacteria bacterium]|nr:DedA family protein [Pseudomonadota bacterium]